MERYDVRTVFTPSTTATHTFVERERLNQRLVHALWTPGKQIVVFGRSGGGKTTLLENKLRQVYETHISTKCMGTTTFEQCLLDAFDQLAPYYLAAKDFSTSNERRLLEITYQELSVGIGGSRSESGASREERALPPQLTPALLARLLGQAKACWILEDFHKVQTSERVKLAQAMKLFMDVATEFSEVKVIAIGAVSSARDVVACDPEMWNRISEIEVDLMTQSEVDQIIEKGEECLNVEVPRSLRDEIWHYSNGLPSVCHQLCLNLCLNRGRMVTEESRITFDRDDLAKAVELWLEDATDSLRRMYDMAAKAKRTRQFDNCRLVMHALAQFGKEGATYNEVMHRVRDREPNYPTGNLTIYLNQLCSEEREFVLFQDPTSGRYSYSSPMLHAYVRALNRAEDEGEISPIRDLERHVSDLLRMALLDWPGSTGSLTA